MKKEIQTDKHNAKFSPFGMTVLAALNKFHDDAWLADTSPLSSAYFLGSSRIETHLNGHSTPEQARADSLRELLCQATMNIGGKDSHLYHQIIECYYFRELSLAEAMAEIGFAPTSRATFYKHHDRAINALENALAQLAKPALRLETPVRSEHELWGRDAQREGAMQALSAKYTVSLLGTGGIGKTSLASYLCQEWSIDKPKHPVFWFTLRLGLNDRLEGLLHALGYFLHMCGVSTLWMEMVAAKGQVEPELALNIIRNDTAELSERSIVPLLSIDEVDLLQTAVNADHSQLLSFIEGMHGLMPMLIVGQQPLVEADVYIDLSGLNRGEISQFLQRANVMLTADERKTLHQHTGGNPRLLHLFVALNEAGEPIDRILKELGRTPPLEYLLGRMLRRLSTEECALLKRLSVHRRPIPLLQNNDIIQNLFGRRLVQMYGQDDVGVLPAYRAMIYDLMPIEQRQKMHRQAADVRAGLGDYTAAAWHLIAAGEVAMAIALWYAHRRQEINGGQGRAALAIFRAVDESALPDDGKHVLAQIYAELEQLTGNPAQALADIRSLLAKDNVTTLDAYAIAGYIANEQGEFASAHKYFQELKVHTEKLVTKQLAVAHKGFHWLAMRERELDTAWMEAQITRYEAENFQGVVQQMWCNYKEAESFYLSALALAEEIGHAEGISRTAYNLTAVYSFVGRFDEAKVYQQKADEITEKIGKIAFLLGGQINKAMLYCLAEDFQEAVDILRQTEADYSLYESLFTSREDALLNQGLAEAYLGLGDIDSAEECVRRSLDTEETDTRADSLRTFGEVLLKRGQPDDAEYYIKESIALAQEQGNPFLVGYGWRALAQVQKAMSNKDEASISIKEAIRAFSAIKISHEVQKTQELM